MDWKERQVLVTGGASFIGSHLVDALVDRGARVRVVDDLSSGRLGNIQPHLDTRRVQFIDANLSVPGVAEKVADEILNHPVEQKLTITRSRPPHYGSEVQQALHLAWTAANHICAKRLVPFLPMLVASLEHHGHLHLSEECRAQLLAMSPATADRILQSSRKQERHGLSTTKSGTLLKKQIPIRTFQEWNDIQPGFLEADLVAHCGESTPVEYFNSLTRTSISTTWTECLALLNRSRSS